MTNTDAMNEHGKTEPAKRPEQEAGWQPYVRPQVTTYGTIEEITQAISGNNTDMALGSQIL